MALALAFISKDALISLTDSSLDRIYVTCQIHQIMFGFLFHLEQDVSAFD
jgi:hypothetical protein